MHYTATEFEMLLQDLRTAQEDLEELEEYYQDAKKILLEAVLESERSLKDGRY